MSAEKARRTIQERYPDFNPASFEVGNRVAIYYGGQWTEHELVAPLELRGGQVVVKVRDADPAQPPIVVELGRPPKKIELPSISEIELEGKIYGFDSKAYYFDEDGNSLLDLTRLDTGERILGVDAAFLREYESAREKTRKSDVGAEVERVMGMGRRELLTRQLGLEQKIQKMMAEFGSPSEWTDFDTEEIEDLRTAVGKMRDEIEKIALDLRREVDTVVGGQEKTERARQAEVYMERLKRLEDIALAGPKKKYDEEQEAREQWLKEKAEDDDWVKRDRGWREYPDKKLAFDDALARGGGGKGKKMPPDPGATRPPEPEPRKGPPQGTEPHKPKEIKGQPIRDKAAFEFYERLDDKDEVKKEVDGRRKATAKIILGADVEDYPIGSEAANATDEEKRQAVEYRTVTVVILRQLLLIELKGKTAEKQPEFEFDKEKKEMEDKVIKLRREAEAFPDIIKMLEEVEEFLRDARKTAVAGGQAATTGDDFLEGWKRIGKIELELYKKGLVRSRGVEAAVKEREIDVPQRLWERILAGRRDEANRVLEIAYTSVRAGAVDSAAIQRALEHLFANAPDEDTLRQLRACGIRSWEGFQIRLRGELGKKLAAVLGEMAQDHLRREAARSISAWDKFSAMPGQVFARSAANVVLVGGTATLAMALVGGPEAARVFGSTGTAQKIMGSIGGAIGGAISSVLGRLIWGREGAKKKTAERMADLEKDKGEKIAPGLAREQQDYFSAILSQAMREASAKPLAGTEPEEAKQLDVNARRLYVYALERLEMAGQDVDAEQKKKLAVALLQMQAGTKQRAETALAVSEPSVARLLTGDEKIYSGKQTEGNKPLLYSAVVGALMGLTLSGRGMEFTGGMALGGAAGYGHGENERRRAEMGKGIRSVEKDVEVVDDLFSRLRPDKVRSKLAGFEADIATRERDWGEDLPGQREAQYNQLKRFRTIRRNIEHEKDVSEGRLRELDPDTPGYQDKKRKLEAEIQNRIQRLQEIDEEVGEIDERVDLLTRRVREVEELRGMVKRIRDVIDIVVKLKAALTGGQMKEVEGEGGVKVQKPVDEQWYVMALQNNPMLRARVESLVYEAEKAGMLVEEEAREDLDLVLQRLAERSEEIEEQVKSLPVGGGRLRTAAYAGAGAAAGLVLGWAASGISEASRHVLQDWLGIERSPITKH